MSDKDKDVAATDEVVDIEPIDPVVESIVLNGIDCRVKRIKTRQFLALMRVFTLGLGPALGNIEIDFDDEENMAQDFASLLIVAIPNAVPQFMAFISEVVEPVDEMKSRELREYVMDNPEIEDLIEVVSVVARQEVGDIASLVKKVRSMWKVTAAAYRQKKKGKTTKK